MDETRYCAWIDALLGLFDQIVVDATDRPLLKTLEDSALPPSLNVYVCGFAGRDGRTSRGTMLQIGSERHREGFLTLHGIDGHARWIDARGQLQSSRRRARRTPFEFLSSSPTGLTPEVVVLRPNESLSDSQNALAVETARRVRLAVTTLARNGHPVAIPHRHATMLAPLDARVQGDDVRSFHTALIACGGRLYTRVRARDGQGAARFL